jgi:hypothetical protein
MLIKCNFEIKILITSLNKLNFYENNNAGGR